MMGEGTWTMSRQQVGWTAAIGLSLLFLLVTGRYAYDANALGASTAGLVSSAIWALGVLAALGNLVGLLGVIKDSSASFAIRVINSLAGRLLIVGLSVALGVVFLIAALHVEPPRIWSCNLQRRRVVPPDRTRCGDTGFAQMRSFQLRLVRASDLEQQPTLRAQVHDRSLSSVDVDSDRGGLCVATGPDQPTRGESRLALSPDCGADRVYLVNVHVCDTKVIAGAGDSAAELRAAVQLEMREGNNAYIITCE
jgi:hypothetical protein